MYFLLFSVYPASHRLAEGGGRHRPASTSHGQRCWCDQRPQTPHRGSRLLQLRLFCRRCSVVCPISLVWKLSIYIRSADQRTAQTVSAAECAAAKGTFGSASKSDVTTTTQCRPNGQAADHKDPQLRSWNAGRPTRKTGRAIRGPGPAVRRRVQHGGQRDLLWRRLGRLRVQRKLGTDGLGSHFGSLGGGRGLGLRGQGQVQRLHLSATLSQRCQQKSIRYAPSPHISLSSQWGGQREQTQLIRRPILRKQGPRTFSFSQQL